MRKLTNQELRKLKIFRELISGMNNDMVKNPWGKFKSWFDDLNYRKEIVLESIEVFLIHSEKEIEEQIAVLAGGKDEV